MPGQQKGDGDKPKPLGLHACDTDRAAPREGHSYHTGTVTSHLPGERKKNQPGFPAYMHTYLCRQTEAFKETGV